MATKLVLNSPGPAREGGIYHRPVRRMRLVLPIVLVCYIAIVQGINEQMMIAPIEVIEEWGCYDTEIRLTCGNLESKIAILEARFTPHCQDQRNCVYMDENSIAHPFASQKVDKLILEETEAGRRFLATLRRNHEKEMLEAGGESHPSSAQPDDGSTIVVARSLAKDKRSSLRATLEHLIVRYLRRLTASGDDDENGEENGEAARYRRQSPMGHERTTTVGSFPPPDGDEPVGGTVGTGVISNSMEITLLTNDTDTNLTDSWDASERFQQQQQQQLKDSGHGYGLPGSSVSGQSADKGVERAHESGARRDTAWDRSVGASAGEERVPPHGAYGGGGLSGSSEGVENTASEGHQQWEQQQGSDVSATHDKLRVGDGDGMPLGVGSDPGMGTGEGNVKAPGNGGGLRRQKQRECGNVRKRVSQLDRFELERSMRNGSFREYNIRNALNYRVHYIKYSGLGVVQGALDKGEVDLGMMLKPISRNHSQQTVVARMEQNLYLPINHTHHSSTFFLDIFSLDLRYAILGFVLLITLLNALLMSRHSPWRHLLFLYELLSGTQARPYRRGQHPYVPNRTLQLLLGGVQQIVVCAMATFLVAQLSIPIINSPLKSVADLADHPQYSLCIPRMHNFLGHMASFVRFQNLRNKVDRECLRRVDDPALLAEYLCDAKRDVVLITNDVILNNIFPDRSVVDRMCELQLIQKGFIKNWVAIPYGSRFKHGEQIKRFCSGKNHCSFVFSHDHPFAVVWKEGTVRIKYICMEEFRISKYCGGHLIVGNEIHWESLDGDDEEDEDTVGEDFHPQAPTNHAGSPAPSWQQPNGEPMVDGAANGFANDARWHGTREDGVVAEDLRVASTFENDYGGSSPYARMVRAGEPRAEALQAATVHSFHNLKIFKPIDESELQQQQHLQHQLQQKQHEHQQQNDTDERNPETEATRSRSRQRQKVFSQDFRVLKILPSNLDVVEDIKQIGNEYYFKKDVEIVVDDSENEIIDGREEQPVVVVDTAGQQQQRGVDDFTTSDGSEQTETLDIVVLPAPTKDVEIYDTELLPTEATTRESDGDISVIGLITSTRMGTTSAATPVVEPSGTPAFSVVETTLGHWDETGLDLPEQEGADNRTKGTGVYSESDSTPFSFNNRTFQTIQDTVRRQELDESQGPYPPVGGYDEEDEGDDEDDLDDIDDKDSNVGRTDHDSDGSSERPHRKYLSVQRTQLNHPLHQGFLMTPSYPKYYIGESVCRWTLHAGLHQRIKLTVLDLALRFDEECRDYLQVVDLNTNRTLFHSCSESNRLIEIVSIQERLEVSIHTTTKVIYPKRGVLIHYTALGCEVPSPTPGHMQLVRRTERRAKFDCDPLYVFPDTGESSRELICTAKHTWNRPLPACIEKRATEGSGLVSHYEQTRRFGDIDSMSDKQADTVYDILIPSFIIAGLFIVNGIVFAVIMRYRNKRKQRLDLESKELAEL